MNTYTLQSTRFAGQYRNHKTWVHPLPTFQNRTFDQIKSILGSKRDWNIEKIEILSYADEQKTFVLFMFKTSTIYIQIDSVDNLVASLLNSHKYNQKFFELYLNRKCTHTIIDRVIDAINDVQITCETVHGFEQYTIKFDDVAVLVRQTKSFDDEYATYCKKVSDWHQQYFNKKTMWISRIDPQRYRTNCNFYELTVGWHLCELSI